MPVLYSRNLVARPGVDPGQRAYETHLIAVSRADFNMVGVPGYDPGRCRHLLLSRAYKAHPPARADAVQAIWSGAGELNTLILVGNEGRKPSRTRRMVELEGIEPSRTGLQDQPQNPAEAPSESVLSH